jgi:Uma2 family endonuclease
MTEAHTITMPPGGWTVDDLDSWPETHVRYELTDGALTVSPSPSSLHQAVSGRLFARLDAVAPADLVVTQAVEIRFARQLTRIPDLLVVRSDDPARHWFAPSEVLLAVEIDWRAGRLVRRWRRIGPVTSQRTPMATGAITRPGAGKSSLNLRSRRSRR